MRFYRKLPVVIEAEQFTGHETQARRLGLSRGVTATGGTGWFVATLEGDMLMNVGAWLIVGVKGEKYPCADDIFQRTYEPA